MSRRALYKLIGFLTPLSEPMGFLVPLFQADNCFFIQDINNQGFVSRFLQTRQPKPAELININKGKILKAGDAALFAFSLGKSKIFSGDKESLSKILEEISHELSKYPFIYLDALRFLEHEEKYDEAITCAARTLGRTDSEMGTIWEKNIRRKITPSDSVQLDLKQNWEKTKAILKSKMNENSFALWIKPIKILEIKDDTLVLACPNRFSTDWIKENYLDEIGTTLKNFCQKSIKISLQVKRITRSKTISDIGGNFTLMPTKLKRGRQYNNNWLNSFFTFEKFVVGSCNESTYDLLKSISHNGNSIREPIFIYANTGLGKTHISHAFSHELLNFRKKSIIQYVTAEDFVNELIVSIRTNNCDAFIDRYSNIYDILILEEFHYFGGKFKVQEKLIGILDILSDKKKKVIITSSLLPGQIPSLSKDLVYFLNSSIITEMLNADYQTRISIIKMKLRNKNLFLSDDCIHLIGTHLTRDIRQIESIINCLKVKSYLLDKKEIDIDLVREIIKVLNSYKGTINLDDIMNLVCLHFKIDRRFIKSRQRKREYCHARNVYMYLSRLHTMETIAEIGMTVNMNPSAVSNSLSRFSKKMKDNEKIQQQVNDLSNRIDKYAFFPRNYTNSISNVMQLVKKFFKLDEHELKYKSSEQTKLEAINIYLYLSRYFTDATLDEISETVSKSPSTVLHAVSNFEKKLKNDNVLKEQVDFLSQRLNVNFLSQ